MRFVWVVGTDGRSPPENPLTGRTRPEAAPNQARHTLEPENISLSIREATICKGGNRVFKPFSHRSANRPDVPRRDQTLKLSPQLQLAFALGLENLKPPPTRLWE